MSNDPILDSKVVPDELGQLGRPAERAGPAWPARAGQPGRPVLPAGARLAPTWRAGGLLPGKGTREERRRGRSAQELRLGDGWEGFGRRLGDVREPPGRGLRDVWETFGRTQVAGAGDDGAPR